MKKNKDQKERGLKLTLLGKVVLATLWAGFTTILGIGTYCLLEYYLATGDLGDLCAVGFFGLFGLFIVTFPFWVE